MNEELKKIYTNSKNGIIPTEQESAEIKGFFKELRMVGESDFYNDMVEEFPVEYGEALDEMEVENVQR